MEKTDNARGGLFITVPGRMENDPIIGKKEGKERRSRGWGANDPQTSIRLVKINGRGIELQVGKTWLINRGKEDPMGGQAGVKHCRQKETKK